MGPRHRSRAELKCTPQGQVQRSHYRELILPAQPGRYAPLPTTLDARLRQALEARGDNYPGGVGLSAPLYDRHAQVVTDAHALVAACGCSFGCPSCVGPILSSDEVRGYSPKAAALTVLDLFHDPGKRPSHEQ